MKQIVLVATVVFTALSGLSAPVQGNDDHDRDRDRRDNTFSARLQGENETPPISTVARGFAAIRINDDDTAITFRVSYADMEGVPSVSHIHFGTQFGAGGVMVFFCGGGGKPACPPSPATIEGTITAADVVGPAGQGIAPLTDFAEVINAIREGLSYANVHSDKFPAGEIRGQLR